VRRWRKTRASPLAILCRVCHFKCHFKHIATNSVPAAPITPGANPTHKIQPRQASLRFKGGYQDVSELSSRSGTLLQQQDNSSCSSLLTSQLEFWFVRHIIQCDFPLGSAVTQFRMSSVRSISGPRLTQKSRRTVAPRSSLVVRAGAERVTQSKDDIIVSPSILSANFSRLGADVRAYQLCSLSSWLHEDPYAACCSTNAGSWCLLKSST
jgi:hypothetical protein